MKKETPAPSYTIAEKADILHQAAQLYMASNMPIDYGTGQTYTPVEVHTLKYIIDHPGKTTTELSLDWDKTKAAVSQLMKKLESKDLVLHQPAPGSEKKQLYFPTNKGLALHTCHLDYDTRVFGETLKLMEDLCSPQDIETCFHVLSCYITARRKKHYHSDSKA